MLPMRVIYYILPLLLFSKVYSSNALEPSEKLRLLRHLEAYGEAKEYLSDLDDKVKLSPDLLKEKIHLLALSMPADESLGVFREFCKENPELESDRDLLEALSWAVIEEAFSGSSRSGQQFAMIASALTREAPAQKIILNSMKSSSVNMRMLAVRLVPLLRDAILERKVLEIALGDTSDDVKLECIRALAKMESANCGALFGSILEDPHIAVEIKREVLSQLYINGNLASPKAFEDILSSPHSYLRAWACVWGGENPDMSSSESLLPLLEDSQAHVQVAAIQALIRLKVPCLEEKLWKLRQKGSEEVKIASAWALLSLNAADEEELFLEFFKNRDVDVQVKAANALLACGDSGWRASKNFLKKFTDFPNVDNFVKANLALACLEETESREIILEILSDPTNNLSFESWIFPQYGILVKNNLSQRLAYEDIPGTIDLLTRIHILHKLHLHAYDNVEKTLKNIFRKSEWMISTNVAEYLLSEGDEEFYYMFRTLLSDEDIKVSLSSALALIVWGKDTEALGHLLKIYPKLNYEQQIATIEVLGGFPDDLVRKFLIEQLSSSFVSVKLAAASSLIQNLRKG